MSKQEFKATYDELVQFIEFVVNEANMASDAEREQATKLLAQVDDILGSCNNKLLAMVLRVLLFNCVEEVRTWSAN